MRVDYFAIPVWQGGCWDNMIEFFAGDTDKSIDIFIQDSSSTTGAGLTGLVYNSAGLTCYYRKGLTGSATQLTLATQTVGGAHSDGGFVEIDATNMPGMYRLDLSDTIINTQQYVSIFLQGAADMAPVPVRIEVLSPTRGKAGTALPNAAADAAGGLPISDAGGFDIDNRAPNATSITNMNTVFNTDFSSNYNTTVDAWNTSVVYWIGDSVAAAVSGSVPSHVYTMANDVITAAKIAADAITEIQAGLATAANLAVVAGYLDTEIASLIAELAKVPKSDSNVSWNSTALAAINAEADTALSDYGALRPTVAGRTLGVAVSGAVEQVNLIGNGGIQENSFANGAISDLKFAEDAINAFVLSTDATAEIASAVWASVSRTLTAFSFGVTVSTNNDKTGYSLVAGTGLGNQTANITGTLSGTVGGIAGTINTLDQLDTAQDAQHAITQVAVDTVDNFIDTEVGTIITELAKVPKSDGSVTWNATALASIQSEANGALGAFNWTLVEIGAVAGAVGSVFGGINVGSGTITTLDQLDTAQDTQHSSTQTAVSAVNTKLGTPAGASVSVDIASVKTDTTTLLSRITSTLFSGITSMAQWLGLIATSKVGNTTARTELNATGAGSGTFNETQHSTQAIRARGDVAWITGSGGGGGDCDGSGAYLISITVDDGTDPIQNADVRFTMGVESYVQRTDVNGQISFNLNDGTWDVTITRAGYSFTPTQLVVDGPETETYSMTAVVIVPAVDPDTTTGYMVVRDNTLTPQSGVVVEIRMIEEAPEYGNLFDKTWIADTSDVDGLVSWLLVKEATYEMRINGELVCMTFEVPSDAESTWEITNTVSDR